MEHKIIRYFKQFLNILKKPLIVAKLQQWKPNGLSKKKHETSNTSKNSLAPELDYINHAKMRAKFDGSCLKQDKICFNYKGIVNLFMVYEINLRSLNLDGKFTLSDSLFDVVQLTRNADRNKYSYYRYMGFDTHGTFSLSDSSGCVKNIIVFGVDNSFSVHAYKRKKDYLKSR